MAISSSVGSAVLTDQMIGTAYDNVREVATNIEYVKHVSAHLEQLYDIYENMELILNVDVSSMLAYVTSAEAARDKAEQWAEEAEDVAVETGQYSAKHWMLKAEDQYLLADTARIAAEVAQALAEQAAGGSDPVADQITAAATDTTPDDTSEWGYRDVASTLLRKLTWLDIKASLKTYFDTVYATLVHTHAIADSTGLQDALDAKAPLASPTLTGTPVAPTAAPGTDTTQIATTGFVKAAVDVVLGGVAAAGDTLAELYTLLTAHTGSTANPHSVTKAQVGLSNVDNTTDAAKPVSTATQTALDLKAPLASPTFTGTVALPSGQALISPVITGSIKEDVYDIVDGAAVDIDPANGAIQTWALGASRTPTAANFLDGQSVTLRISDGTSYAVTWTTIGVVWAGGSAPTLAETGYTQIELWKVGTTIYGAVIGDFAS